MPGPNTYVPHRFDRAGGVVPDLRAAQTAKASSPARAAFKAARKLRRNAGGAALRAIHAAAAGKS